MFASLCEVDNSDCEALRSGSLELQTSELTCISTFLLPPRVGKIRLLSISPWQEAASHGICAAFKLRSAKSVRDRFFQKPGVDPTCEQS